MKIATETSKIRRRSNFSVIFLFIPIVNYLFFFFQTRGAYIAIRNYYQFHKELPNAARTLVISIKYSIWGTIGGLLAYLILFPLSNPFGNVAAFYMKRLGDVFAGTLSLDTSAFLFGKIPTLLSAEQFDWSNLETIGIFMAVTYFSFSIIGVYLAVYNIKSDLRHNLINI